MSPFALYPSVMLPHGSDIDIPNCFNWIFLIVAIDGALTPGQVIFYQSLINRINVS